MSDLPINELRDMLSILTDIKGTLPGLGKSISSNAGFTRGLAKAEAQALAAGVALRQATDKQSQAYRDLEERSLKANTNLKATREEFAAQTGTIGKATEANKKWSEGLAKANAKAQLLGDTMRKGHGMLTKYNGAFGVQKIGLQNSIEAVVKYNDGMFNLTRTQRLFGKEGSNVDAALSSFSKNTTMSTNEALEFSNSFDKLYLGVKPTAQEVAGFAESLQQSFGPNVKKTNEVMVTFLGIQKQAPAVFDSIRAAHTKMTEAMKSGSAGAKAEAEAMGAGNIAVLMGMDVDTGVIEEVLRYQTETTKAEGDRFKTEEQITKAQQANKDAILATGQAGEGAFRGMAKLMESTYGWLQKNTGAAIAFGVALEGLNMARGLGQMGSMIGKMKGGSGGSALMGNVSYATKKRGGLGSKVTTSKSFGSNFQAARGGGKVAASANAAAGVYLAAQVMGFASTIGKSQEAIDKQADEFVAKGSVNKLSDGFFHAGKTIALFSRVAVSRAKAFGELKEARKGTDHTNTGLQGALEKKYGSKFQEKASAAGLDQAKGTEERAKILSKISKELRDQDPVLQKINVKAAASAKLASEEKNAIGKTVAAYKAKIANLQIQVMFQERIVALSNAEVDIATQFGTLTSSSLQKQISDTKELVGLSQKRLSFTQGMSAELSKKAGIDINLKGLDPKQMLAELEKASQSKSIEISGLETAAEAAPEGKDREQAEEAVTAAIAQQNAIKATASKISQDQLVVTKGTAQVTEMQTMAESKLVTQAESFNSLLQGRIDAERQLYEQAQFGMGASLAMMQQQIQLEKDRIKQAKEYLNVKGAQLSKDYEISSESVKDIENAKTRTSQQAAINKALDESQLTGKARDSLEQKLNVHAKEYTKHQTATMQAQSKIFELTKGMREGYLSAIMAMQVNAGEFTKIIGTQEKGASQLMNIVGEATGDITTLATNAIGGQGNIKQGDDAGRRKAAAEFTHDRGVVTQMTKEQGVKRSKMLRQVPEAAKNPENLDIGSAQGGANYMAARVQSSPDGTVKAGPTGNTSGASMEDKVRSAEAGAGARGEKQTKGQQGISEHASRSADGNPIPTSNDVDAAERSMRTGVAAGVVDDSQKGKETFIIELSLDENGKFVADYDETKKNIRIITKAAGLSNNGS